MEKLSSAPFPPWTLSSPLFWMQPYEGYIIRLFRRRSLSQTKYSSSWTLLSSSGWDERGRSREGDVFQRYRRFIYDACKRSRVEAEIDNVRFRIPRFLVCHDETCILRFVEAWSLFSNIYYIRLIFLIPRWRVSVFIKELVFLSTFTRFHFRVVNPLLRKCEFELPFEAKRRKRFLLLPSFLSLFPSLPLFPAAWIPTGNELSSFPLSRTENRLPNPREAFHFAQRKNSTAAV